MNSVQFIPSDDDGSEPIDLGLLIDFHPTPKYRPLTHAQIWDLQIAQGWKELRAIGNPKK